LRAYLIDPFQRKVHTLDVTHELSAWYDMLECSCVDVVRIGTAPNGNAIDVWVDDEGLLRNEPYPLFRLGEGTLCGYGLVLECDSEGKSLGVSFGHSWFEGKLRFEPWERRLNPADYFEQLTRVPSWECVSS
jgi:hypothetical protein